MFIKVKPNSNSAFTLAEVLITLVSVGVLAMLTIPSLLAYVDQMKQISSWKSNFANLSQAVAMVATDAGGRISAYQNAYDARNAFSSRMNFVLQCDGTTQAALGCWHADPKQFDLTTAMGIPGTSSTDESSAVLSGGALIMFSKITGTDPIGPGSGSFTCLADDSTPCIDVFIDTNGFSTPNALGKDIFKATVYADKIGFSETSFGCGAGMGSGDTIGTGCGKYYLTRSS